MYPLCTHELSTALLLVWTCSTSNFLIMLAILSLTVNFQNGCIDAILKFTLSSNSPSYIRRWTLACYSKDKILNQQLYSVSSYKEILMYLGWSRWPLDLRRRSWPLGSWGRGFKSWSGHGFLSLCFCAVLSCAGGLCAGLIICPKESHQVSQ
jgi:hypothetical protein